MCQSLFFNKVAGLKPSAQLFLHHIFFPSFKIILSIDEIFNDKTLQVPRAMLEAFVLVEVAVYECSSK